MKSIVVTFGSGKLNDAGGFGGGHAKLWAGVRRGQARQQAWQQQKHINKKQRAREVARKGVT